MSEDSQLGSKYAKNSLLQDKLLWIAREYQKQGIYYAEIAATDLTKKGEAGINFLKQVHKIVPLAEEETGVSLRFLVAIRRIWLTSDQIRESLDVLKAMAHSPYVVGSDIVGEELNDIKEFEPIIKELVEFAIKENNGFTIRIHAGENDAFKENIERAVECVENAIPEMSSPANTERTTKCNFLASIKEFFARIFGLRQNKKQNEAVQKQETVDPRVADINITAETDKVRTEYPDYLDRKTIYEQYQVEDAEGNLYDGPKLEDNISSYNNLLGFIKSSKFYRYLKDSHDNWIELKKTIESIESMQNERVKFSAFKEKVAELKGELKVLNQKINDFRLTEHSSSVDNLIDIEKLIEFHREGGSRW